MNPLRLLISALCLFPCILSAQQQQPGKRLEAAFERLDRNGDGRISPTEAPERAEVIRAADRDRSGDLSIGELREWFGGRNLKTPDPEAEPQFIVAKTWPADAPVTEASCRAAADYSAKSNGYTFLVMFDGKVLFERYDQGWTPETPHRLASGTKSFSGGILAAAVKDELLTVDEPVSKTISEWKSEPRLSKITIRQLLSLTSGIDPGENGTVPAYSDAFRIKTGLHKPGTKFAYGPRPFQIFGELMRRKLAANPDFETDDPLKYLEAKILKPIGLNYAGWRTDTDGRPHLPSGAHLTAREWVKYGEFLRNGGTWKDESLVDTGTLKECIRGSAANLKYGLTFWLSVPGVYQASGAGKQRLYILPEKKLVVVRQGESGRKFQDKTLLERLTPAPAPSQ